jgi:hypothetical protein
MEPIGTLDRRRFLHLGCTAFAAARFIGGVEAHADELKKQQRACILIWLGGGASQMETWDPKPGTPNGGQTKAISTAVSGIQIADIWPKTAALMKDISLIRTITSKEGEHGRATYQMHTGRRPTGALKFPNLGSVVASELGNAKSEIPNFISVGDTLGPGFLGVHTAPFIVRRPGMLPDNVALGVPAPRLSRRLALLKSQDEDFGEAGAKDLADEHQGIYSSATRLVQSTKLKAFDLAKEPEGLRKSYGNGGVGQGLLLARRLVEAGVPFVEVRHGGWDNHDKIFEQSPKNAAQVDPGMAALIADLKSREMLERTLVICMGEFGRTPKVNARAGRDHWPNSFSLLLAGGGIRGGQVIGKTSPDGMTVTERPVSVPDLFQTFCKALTLNPTTELMTPQGRPIKIVDDGAPVKELFG